MLPGPITSLSGPRKWLLRWSFRGSLRLRRRGVVAQMHIYKPCYYYSIYWHVAIRLFSSGYRCFHRSNRALKTPGFCAAYRRLVAILFN